MPTRHLESFGARSIPRAAFAEALAMHLDRPSAADWRAKSTAVSWPTLGS